MANQDGNDFMIVYQKKPTRTRYYTEETIAQFEDNTRPNYQPCIVPVIDNTPKIHHHHYYGPDGQGPHGPPQVPNYGLPPVFTVFGPIENGHVMAINPELSTPGVNFIPTEIVLEIERAYGHLKYAEYSVSCSHGNYTVQVKMLSPEDNPKYQPPPRPKRKLSDTLKLDYELED
jgi:hypothetical protein